MDTSETYIKMLYEGWFDLEELWIPQPLTQVARKGSLEQVLHDFSDRWDRIVIEAVEESGEIRIYNWRTTFKDHHLLIPLLSQDQLQEMYARYIADELEMTEIDRSLVMQTFLDFSVWLGVQYKEEKFVCLPTNMFESGEQLWLAFVMKVKHNKVWNGTEWGIE